MCLINKLTPEGQIIATPISKLCKNDSVGVTDTQGNKSYAKVLCVVKIQLNCNNELV